MISVNGDSLRVLEEVGPLFEIDIAREYEMINRGQCFLAVA
jgi:hypothetical protein